VDHPPADLTTQMVRGPNSAGSSRLDRAESIEGGKAKTEAAYPGLHSRWVDTDVSVEEAQRCILENY